MLPPYYDTAQSPWSAPTKLLKYCFKTPFTRSILPSIWKRKAVLNLSFIPTSLEKCIENALVNFGSWSDTITLGNPWCLNHPLTKGYVVSNAVAVPTIGTMCVDLANRFTINKMVLYTCDSSKLVIKSMHILCHGPDGIGNGCKKPPFFL